MFAFRPPLNIRSDLRPEDLNPKPYKPLPNVPRPVDPFKNKVEKDQSRPQFAPTPVFNPEAK